MHSPHLTPHPRARVKWKSAQQISVNDDFGYDLYRYDFEAIQFLPDGSFLAHWFNNNAGGRDTGPHWVNFNAAGHRSVPHFHHVLSLMSGRICR